MRASSVLAPLKQPGFRRVWAGQSANVVGDAVLVVALAVYLVGRPDRGLALSLVLAALSLGGVVSVLVGGVLADRYRRTRLIIAADVVRAAAVVGLLVVGADGSLGLLVGAGLLLGIGSGLYQPAYAALYPGLVPPADLVAANSLRVLTNRAAAVGGAAFGGLLVTVSTELALVVDVLTFAVSIMTLLRPVDGDGGGAGEIDPHASTSLVRLAGEGFRYVRSVPWMIAVMLQGTVQVAMVHAPLAVLLPITMSHPKGSFGAAVTAEAIGALVGAFVAQRWVFSRRGALALGGCAAQLAVSVPLALGGPWQVLVVGMFVTGAGLAVFAILWTTALQQQVAEHLRGRVFALDTLTAIGFAPVGTALTGYLLQFVPARSIAAVASVVLAVSVAACLRVPGVMRLSTVPAESPA